MNKAKQFLASKGIYNLDTQKRYNEVISWMAEFGQALCEEQKLMCAKQMISPKGLPKGTQAVGGEAFRYIRSQKELRELMMATPNVAEDL